MKNDFETSNDSFWIVMDNASIHKTTKIQKFFKFKGIHALTIPPYSPSLNAAELVIQAIKAKIRQRRGQGK